MIDGILIVDAKQTITLYNRRAAELLGWPQLHGKSIASIIENKSAETSPLLKALNLKHPIQRQIDSFQHSDGQSFWAETTLSELESQDMQGEWAISFHPVINTTQPIDPHSTIGQFFRSNHLFGMFYADVYGHILDVNTVFLNMVGYTREELLNTPIGWKELTPSQYMQQDQIALQNIKKYGTFTPYEKQFIKKDGTIMDVLIGPMMGEMNPEHGFAFVLDITQQKKFQRAASEGERLFKAMAECAPVLIWVCDTEMRVNYANQKLLDYLNCTYEEFANKSWIDFIHPDDVASTLEFLDIRTKHAPGSYEFEVRVIQSDGSFRWAINRGGAIIADDGSHIGWIGSVWDIHDRRLAEEANLEYAKQLERSNQELEQFATLSSHDLQEPLRKVMIFSDHLKQISQDKLCAEALDDLERIQRATGRMQRLIQDLLDLSKVTRRGAAYTKIFLREIFMEALAELSYHYQDAKSRVHIEGEAIIEADSNQIRQMLIQLLDNALKFHAPETPSHVQVTIKSNPDGFCSISLEDNGLGMNAEYLNKIFNTFVRLHPRKDDSGTGIGLRLVQKIVDRHNGTITVSSEPGQGSTFVVILPILQNT